MKWIVHKGEKMISLKKKCGRRAEEFRNIYVNKYGNNLTIKTSNEVDWKELIHRIRSGVRLLKRLLNDFLAVS